MVEVVEKQFITQSSRHHNGRMSSDKTHPENGQVTGFSQSKSRQQCCNGRIQNKTYTVQYSNDTEQTWVIPLFWQEQLQKLKMPLFSSIKADLKIGPRVFKAAVSVFFSHLVVKAYITFKCTTEGAVWQPCACVCAAIVTFATLHDCSGKEICFLISGWAAIVEEVTLACTHTHFETDSHNLFIVFSKTTSIKEQIHTFHHAFHSQSVQLCVHV